MADRKLVVSVIGDDRSFQETLTRSTAAAKTFARNVNQAMGRGSTVSVGAQFEPLLQRNRQLQAQADDLTQRLQKMDVGFAGASQSSGLLGGSLLGLVGRVSAVGFAINAAYTASRHLQQGLETTGHEATTTEGKLRNLGAALLSGDIVGAFQALRREPQNLEELGISAVQASNRMGALSIVAHTNANALRDQANESQAGQAKLRAFQQAADEAGTSNTKLAQELLDQVAAMQAADNAANALADSTARLGTVFRDSTGQAVLFKGAVDDLGGPRGPGLVDQINAALENERAGRQGRPPQRPLGPASRRANAIIVAQANGDLDEVLRLQTVQRDKLAKALENSHGNVKQRQQLAENYAKASAAVITTGKQIADAAKRAAEAAKRAADEAKKAKFAELISDLELAVSLRKPSHDFVVGQPRGLLEPGNLDILHRKIAKVGKDIATVRSISVSTDLGETLIPTIINGVAVSEKKAIEHFRKTGENLGTFSTVAFANAYGNALHRQQAAMAFRMMNDTAPLFQDLVNLKALRGGVERQIREGVDVVSAQLKLGEVVERIRAKREEIRRTAKESREEIRRTAKESREAASAAEQARQFRRIGLSATGEEIVPSVENLRKRIDNALRKFDSGDLKIGSKLASRLKLARAEIAKEGDNLKRGTRAAIDGWLDSIDKGTKQVDRRAVQLSDQLLAALGFSVNPDVARLSSTRPFGNTSTGAFANASVPHGASVSGVTITGPITVVADNPDAFLRELQKRAGRTSGTARGRFPGRSLGLG